MWNSCVLDLLADYKKKASLGGGEARIQKQHASGKLTARERIDFLLDTGTFTEVNDLMESRHSDLGMAQKRLPGDGVITGYGKVDGRLVFVSSEDFTVMGGTLGEAHSRKICNIIDMALNMKAPIITINDSGGARIEEGVSSLSGYAGIFLRNTRASGVIPQIAVIMGPCAGGACYSPAICDFIFMVEKTGHMFITGPQVVKTVTHENTTVDELGGSHVHTGKSGVAHFSYPKDEDCLFGVRRLLSYLPQSSGAPLPTHPGKPMDLSRALTEAVPDNQRRCYNMKSVIESITDKKSFFEVQTNFAKNAVIGLGRMDGETVGFVANQPNFMGGSLDCDAADKMARFIRFCDCFGIPLIVLVDVPAFLPGVQQEHAGIIRHGAKLLYAFSEATVPKISLILRKAYGGAYIAMNSKNMGADVVYAWPIAEIAVMGAEGAIAVIHRRKIEADPSCAAALIKEYEDRFMNPYLAASLGYIDEVIHPDDTRKKLRTALDMLKSKAVASVQRKHGNIPL